MPSSRPFLLTHTHPRTSPLDPPLPGLGSSAPPVLPLNSAPAPGLQPAQYSWSPGSSRTWGDKRATPSTAPVGPC